MKVVPDRDAMNWMAWAFASAVFAGATATLAKLGVEHVNSHLATAIRTGVVLIFTVIIAAYAVPAGAMGSLSRRSWLFLALSGVGTALSWLCYFRALQLGEASRVAAVDKLGVVFAILFALLFLRERLSLIQGVGALVIVIGVFMIAWKPAC